MRAAPPRPPGRPRTPSARLLWEARRESARGSPTGPGAGWLSGPAAALRPPTQSPGAPVRVRGAAGAPVQARDATGATVQVRDATESARERAPEPAQEPAWELERGAFVSPPAPGRTHGSLPWREWSRLLPGKKSRLWWAGRCAALR